MAPASPIAELTAGESFSSSQNIPKRTSTSRRWRLPRKIPIAKCASNAAPANAHTSPETFGERRSHCSRRLLRADDRFTSQPELHEAALLLGDALLEQKKYTDAIVPLERYAQSNPADRPARVSISSALRSFTPIKPTPLVRHSARPPKDHPILPGCSAHGSSAASLI